MNSIPNLLPDFIEHLEKERQLQPETVRNYRSDLLQLDAFLSGKAVQSIGIPDLRAWMRHLKDLGRAKATIRRKIHTCSSFWRFLHIIGIVDDNMPQHVVKLLPKTTRKTVENYLSVDELKRFVETPAKSVRDYVAWCLLAWLGLRNAELRSIKIQDVHGDTVIIHGKGGHKRTLALPEHLLPSISALMTNQQSSDYLLRGDWGGQWTKDSFRKVFQSHIKRCGLDNQGITPHVVRHTFGTHMVANGVPLHTVAGLMGHKDTTTTEIYAHHAPAHLREAMELHPLKN